MNEVALREDLKHLAEECAELIHATLKKERYPTKREHDGRVLNVWLENEMLDVVERINNVAQQLGMPTYGYVSFGRKKGMTSNE